MFHHINTHILKQFSLILFLFIFSQVHHFQQDQTSHDKAFRASCALQNIIEMVHESLSGMGAALPSIDMGGLSLTVTADAAIDLRPLDTVYASLHEEWQAMQQQGVLGLGPLRAVGKAYLGDVMRFFEYRVFHSSPKLPMDHWMRHLRNAAMRVVAFSFEYAVFTSLSNETVPLQMLQIPEMRSTTTGRKLRPGVLDKRQWLRKLATAHSQGNAETILELLATHKGQAAVVMNFTNAMYEENARSLMQLCRALSMSWDGATYAGLSVNIAMGLCCVTAKAVHMRPVVETPPPLNCVFFTVL